MEIKAYIILWVLLKKITLKILFGKFSKAGRYVHTVMFPSRTMQVRVPDT